MAGRTTSKKAPAKKAATKKRSSKTAKKTAPKANGSADKGPIEGAIEGENKYRLKAAQLEWEKADQEIRVALQPKFNEILNRTRRNSPAWIKANKARLEAVNAFIDDETESLPEGYAIVNVMLDEGTYRASYDPEGRGKHVE